MTNILIEHDPSPMKLEVMNMADWPLIHDAVAVEERTYPRVETTFILRGRAEITAADGQIVPVQRGDLVTFLPQTRCIWKITEALERHCRER